MNKLPQPCLEGTASGQDLGQVTAAILAGGLGTRLQVVAGETPKALMAVSGKPFLAYLLDQLAGAGLREVVLCTGYGAEQIEARFGSQYAGLHLKYSREPSPLGTGGALRRAWPLLTSEWVLALNGDSFAELDLRAFWAWHGTKAARSSLVLAAVADPGRYGRVRTGRTEEVQSFLEKDPSGGEGWINAGIYLLHREVVEAIPPGRPVSLEREVLPGLVGRSFYAYRGCRRFLDIGTVDSYAQAEAFFRHL